MFGGWSGDLTLVSLSLQRVFSSENVSEHVAFRLVFDSD